jgi:hypothetical protein
MRVDEELKRLLAAELCGIVDGWDQHSAASMLGLQQPQVSALRHGRTKGFSSDRLFRVVANRGYDIEVVLRERPRWLATQRPAPKVTVQRIDRLGRAIERPAPGPVKRFRRGRAKSSCGR